MKEGWESKEGTSDIRTRKVQEYSTSLSSIGTLGKRSRMELIFFYNKRGRIVAWKVSPSKRLLCIFDSEGIEQFLASLECSGTNDLIINELETREYG